MFTQTIRRQFLNYFKERGHAIISSSPVVPHEDPTLLFINAGMNQFKDVFLGDSHRDYTRAATSQKCIRVGGKHNDLENVGHTSRHLTFFEMLGNFSFGDYFKKEAIQFAWEASTQVFGFEPDRIWPTVFLDDDEAFEIWLNYVPAERITRFGEKDNFWAMGDTGPCGPCSELLYDRGAQFGTATRPIEDPTGERFLEFWNLVFMQYNRQPNGQKLLLPRPSIDTGAGLERVISLKMGVDSVFETDVLRSLIAQVESLTNIAYHPNDSRSAAFRVIADHVRCLSFAIADGVQPSNLDRGYVLRKVLRRAVRYGRQLGMDKPFLADVLPQLVETMGEDYPELVKGYTRIADILTAEEEAFIRTLKKGGNILNHVIEKAQTTSQLITGDDAFKLKDTYGLPIEEILLIAKDSNLKVDEPRYQELEKEAKERSRNVHKSVNQIASENLFADFAKRMGPTQFVGYQESSITTKVIGLLHEGKFVDQLELGQNGQVLLVRTPFYAEMGGQIGDTGTIFTPNATFIVEQCTSPYKGIIVQEGKLTHGTLKVDEEVEAKIDKIKRQKIANNHTATHLLHWALHQVLGEHIKQAGSVVDAERLRFDFSHHKSVSLEEIKQIEDLINAKIRENSSVKSYEINYEEAQKREDIKQFFGEKYGSLVRVVDIDYSKELCGGTHTTAIGTIGLFRIAKESSIAAGIRRIEAVTGHEAELLHQNQEQALNALAHTLKVPLHQLNDRLNKLIDENRHLNNELKTLKQQKIQHNIENLLRQAEPLGSSLSLIAHVNLPVEDLKTCLDLILEKLKSCVIVLATSSTDKCHFVVRVSDDLVKKGYSAHHLLKVGLSIVEGNGGGKPQQAQGSGKHPHMIENALGAIKLSLSDQTI